MANTDKLKNIPLKELFNLRREGMSYDEICYFIADKYGIYVTAITVKRKLLKEFSEIGEGKRKPTVIELPIEEIIEAKRKGSTYVAILKMLYYKYNIEVSESTLRNKITEYNNKKNEEKEQNEGSRTEEGQVKQKTKEEIIEELSNSGMSPLEIFYRIESGINVSYNELITILDNISERKLLEKKLELPEDIAKIILKGITIEEYVKKCPEKEKGKVRNNLYTTLEKYKFIANHTRMIDGEWHSDAYFEELLSLLDGPTMKRLFPKMFSQVKSFLNGGVACEKGKIDLLLSNVFNNNRYVSYYFLQNMIRNNYLRISGYDEKIHEAHKKVLKEKLNEVVTTIQNYEIQSYDKMQEEKQKNGDKNPITGDENQK